MNTETSTDFPAGKRAKSDQDKRQRRDDILRAALNLFYTLGFANTRIDSIAEQAGVSKGTIYLYFSGKDELFLALIEEIAVPNVQFLEQQLSNAPSVKVVLELITKFAPIVIRTTDLPKLIKILITEAHTFPVIVGAYRENVIKRVLASLANLLEKASAQGEISIGNPEITARLVVAPIVLSMLWVIIFESGDDQPLDIEALLKHHSQLMSKALVMESINES